MVLHHRDGQTLEGPREWIDEQLRLVGQWNLPEYERGLDEHGKVMTWVKFFAAWARKICDDEGVDVDTFEVLFEEFENRVTPDIELLKYVLSERAGRDIGLEETCRHIRGRIDKLMRNGYRYLQFNMIFPFIGEGGGELTRSVRFPVLDARTA